MVEVKECKYTKSIYQNNNFFINIYTTKDTAVPESARRGSPTRRTIEFTAIGYNLPSSEAVIVDFQGDWEKSQYGQQLKVDDYKEKMPQTKEGVIAYLSSGLIKGIGPKTAKMIVSKFGKDTMEIIEKQPNKLLEIKGISEARLEKIVSSIAENRELRDIVTYLAPFDISNKKILKIYKHFGNKTIETLKKEPFKLCDINGFGFRTVDGIAKKSNCKLDDKLRIKAGIKCVLDDAECMGHLYIPKDELVKSVHALLNASASSEVVSKEMIKEELDKGIKIGNFVMNCGDVYKANLWKCEKESADKTAVILNSPVVSYEDIDKEIEVTQKNMNTVLSQSQIEAVKMCFSNSLSIITGGPGTGKTTVLRSILDIYNRLTKNKKVLLAAPTGLAARRMSDATGIEASTLHSALGLYKNEDEDFFEDYEELEYDFIVVDETSMLDMKLTNELLKRVKPKVHMLFVGDVDQLPSVGAGNVLREMINCGIIATTHLDTVFRQAEKSKIALNAHAINNGEVRLLYGSDFLFRDAETTEISSMINQIYEDEVNNEGLENVQILSPFKKRGESATINLNEMVRDLINPRTANNYITKGNKSFRIGDKVMQTKNSANICNGDIGFVKSIYEDEENELILEVEFSGSRIEKYSSDDLDKLELAYAITIHKSQGSEFNTVIIPILKEQFIMLRRNLIYTAVTRAKKKLILVGERRALFMAIGKNDIGKRNTNLGEQIYRATKSIRRKK